MPSGTQSPRTQCAIEDPEAVTDVCSEWDRSFLTRAYPTMKKNNPYIPIMIREAQGTQPRVWARYEFGREKMEDLRGMDIGPQNGRWYTGHGELTSC